MDDGPVFRALADPNRRLLLDRLFERDGRTLLELQSQLAMTRFGVMKHLRVLEDAGLVVTRKVGREKLHYLNPVPIQSISERWMDKYAAARAGSLTDLKRRLEGAEMEAAVNEALAAAEAAARPKQIYQIFIKASPEQIWDAITRPEFTARYFYGTQLESSLKPGEPLVYYTGDRSSTLVEGVVVEADPPRRLTHTWRMLYDPELAGDPPSRVAWEIEPCDGGVCKLTVVHDGFESENRTYREVAGGWMMVLSGLKTLLETGRPLTA
jgi:uncharacterized protein YndB with AHSA1/START domain/DNA-binding transcriptional ArsR family regulator